LYAGYSGSICLAHHLSQYDPNTPGKWKTLNREINVFAQQWKLTGISEKVRRTNAFMKEKLHAQTTVLPTTLLYTKIPSVCGKGASYTVALTCNKIRNAAPVQSPGSISLN
jgi:hypothetical protein